MKNNEEGHDRRGFLRRGFVAALSAAVGPTLARSIISRVAMAVAATTTVAATTAGCGPSGGSSGGSTFGSNPPPPPPPGGGGTTTTVTGALSARYGTLPTTPTRDGNKIIAVGSASGQSLVYTVNGQSDFSDRPENRTVRTGDVIDVFDLANGSRTSLVVS